MLTNNINTQTQAEEDKFQLEDLTLTILRKELGQYLSPMDKKVLAESFLNDEKRAQHMRPSLFAVFPQGIAIANQQIERLLSFVVRGEKVQAESMIKADPRILLYKGKASDYSSRLIYGTALQMALGAKDVSLIEKKDEIRSSNEEEMAEMIERYLANLPNGEEEIAKQKKEQFPEGWEEQEKARHEQDLLALKTVFKAINDSNTDQDCEAAIEAFKLHLQPKGIITTGTHYNDQLLIEAFKLYQELYQKNLDEDAEKNIYNRKNSLAWTCVIGEIEFYAPACFGQSMCQGLSKLANEKQPLIRNLLLPRTKRFYYARNLNAKSGLGLDYAIYSMMTPWCTKEEPGVAYGIIVLQNYAEQKQSQLVNSLKCDATTVAQIKNTSNNK